MAKAPKSKANDDQLHRFKERAEEIGADASEEEFERLARKIITHKSPSDSEDKP